MSKLIVIEGACDGIGKTTQVQMLKDRFKKESVKVYTHHFPTYESDAGRLISNYLSGKYGSINDLSSYFVNSLYAIDRKIVSDELKKVDTDLILLDRYTTSSLIYQSALIDDIEEKKKFIDYVIDYEYNKLLIRKPDEVIFLKAPYDLITNIRSKRKNNSSLSKDIHEENDEYLKKVYDNAIFISNYLSWKIVECSCNNEMKEKEQIHSDIYKLVRKVL